jgi:hypothetical protein
MCQENLKFFKNLTGIANALHEDIRAITIISRSVLLRIRILSGEGCTYFVFSNFF